MRVLWLGIGLISLSAGTLGLFLPLLPTTPFLLVAAWAFARSSPRLHGWLLQNPRLGPFIAAWRDHGVIPPSGKVAAVVGIAATCLLSLLFNLPGAVLVLQVAILTAVLAFILSRPSSPAAARARRLRPRS